MRRVFKEICVWLFWKVARGIFRKLEHTGILLGRIGIDKLFGEFAKIYRCQKCGMLAIERFNKAGMSKARFSTIFCKGRDAMGIFGYIKKWTVKVGEPKLFMFESKEGAGQNWVEPSNVTSDEYNSIKYNSIDFNSEKYGRDKIKCFVCKGAVTSWCVAARTGPFMNIVVDCHDYWGMFWIEDRNKILLKDKENFFTELGDAFDPDNKYWIGMRNI